MMTLYQLSTPTCPPCRMFKGMIESKYSDNLKDYKYIDLMARTEESFEIMDKLRENGVFLKSVPTFVLYDKEKGTIESVTTTIGDSQNLVKRYFEDE